MSEGLLTRTECTAMKGIAILGIMLHNYCHWLQGIVRENEYTWSAWKNDQLWQAILNPDADLPLHLISYFGHYGVPVFLFLSGYGLAMKYVRKVDGGRKKEEGKISLWRFFRYNYLKLFRLLIVGFVAFTMLDAFTPGFHRYAWHEVVAMLGMYANVLEHPSQVVWPGPYWYFGVTLQLYLVYRLLMYRRHWGVTVVLIVICFIWQEFYIDDAETLERLRYNFIGGMLPFGLGTIPLLASPKGRKAFTGFWGAGVLVLSIVGVFLLCFSRQGWLWAPVFIVTGTIALVKLLPASVLRYIVWVGSISAAIFVSHPLVRKIFIRPYIREDMYAGLLLYVVASLFVGWLFMQIINRIPKPKL